MRHIILDTETTGFSPNKGDRIVEIALLEMIDQEFTDNKLVFRFDPKIEIPEQVSKIHGIYAEDVAGMPHFEDKAQEIIEFIGDSTIIAHNAKFDFRFIDHHLNELLISSLKNRVICTMELAKSKIATPKYNLNDLCDYFSIDRSARQLHSAELDCVLCGLLYKKLLEV